LMGEHINGFFFNLVAWVTAIAMIAVTLVLVVQSIDQFFHPPG